MDPALHRLFVPELRGLSRTERAEALRAARATPYEVGELLGMAAALVVAASLASGPWLALALGAIFAAPFLLRRLRRGLRKPPGAPRP